MEQAKTRSVEPQSRFALTEVTWDSVNEPGAYVERGSGVSVSDSEGSADPRQFTHHSQRERRGFTSGSSQHEPVCDHLGSAAPLCAAQHRAEFLN